MRLCRAGGDAAREAAHVIQAAGNVTGSDEVGKVPARQVVRPAAVARDDRPFRLMTIF